MKLTRLPRQLAPLFRFEARQFPAIQTNRPGNRGRGRQKAHGGEGQCALTAARLADQTENRSLLDPERDVVDRRYPAFGGLEPDRDIFQFKGGAARPAAQTRRAQTRRAQTRRARSPRQPAVLAQTSLQPSAGQVEGKDGEGQGSAGRDLDPRGLGGEIPAFVQDGA